MTDDESQSVTDAVPAAAAGMDSAMDDVWRTIMQTRPIQMKEWMGCFEEDGGEEKARREIGDMLTDEDKWKDRTSNFLLRLGHSLNI